MRLAEEAVKALAVESTLHRAMTEADYFLTTIYGQSFSRTSTHLLLEFSILSF